MKNSKYIITLFVLGLCNKTIGQNFIDKYLVDPLVYTTIGTSANSISQPKDLDFKPNSNELWVLNYGTSGGGTSVIFYNAGLPSQTSQYRKDTHSGHFTRNASSMAFSDIGEWGAVSEIQSTGSGSSTFMGPALWSADTNIYARVFQNNWLSGYPLGSHLDMLHQSPNAMGIAHDSAKVYWVFDGWNGNICKYDFAVDHGPGYDVHSAGKIWRYTGVNVQRTPGIPSHLVLDKVSKWLYIVDGGNNRVIRIATNTGTITGPLTVTATANEPLAGYWAVGGVTPQIIDTYTTQQSGIDYYNNRLIVSDYTTGSIRIYDTSIPTPTLMGTINTGTVGIMGVKIGPDGRIWYVNNLQNTVMRIDPLPATIDASIREITSPINENFEAMFFSIKFNQCTSSVMPVVTLQNNGTTFLTSVEINYNIDGGPTTTYTWTGSLATNAIASVTLPVSSVTMGSHKIVAFTSNPNGVADLNLSNDRKAGSFRSVDPIVSYPLMQDFTPVSFPPSGWSYVGFNKNNVMNRNTSTGGYGAGLGCLKMNNFTGPMNITAQKDYFMSPRINMSSASSLAELKFDIAYARRNTSSNDRLQVSVSTDCGATWSTLYNKSGFALATAPDITSSFIPSASQWTTETISMSTYSTQPEVLLLFTSTSGYGNNFYIDNINLNNSIVSGIIKNESINELVVYPNPTAGEVFIKRSNSNKIDRITVTDIIGKVIMEVLSSDLNQKEITLNLSSLNSGTYFIKVKTEDATFVEKLILNTN